jgi:phage shock protein C
MLGGVCGGIAEYLDTDPIIIRLLWVFLTLAYGLGILFYLLAWVIIPLDPRSSFS